MSDNRQDMFRSDLKDLLARHTANGLSSYNAAWEMGQVLADTITDAGDDAVVAAQSVYSILKMKLGTTHKFKRLGE